MELARTVGLALALLAVPLAAAAGDDALLELYLGPNQTEDLALKQVVLRLDGKELPVTDFAGAPEKPVLEVPMASGPHTIDLVIRLDGHSWLFPYLDEYRFTLRGHLDVEARSGQVTAVKGSIERKSGFLIPWESRYRLAYSATSYPTDRVAARAPEAPPVMAAVAAASPLAVAPLACALDPVLFDFDRAVLKAAAIAALDRFAACLGQTTRAVRLEGHCDLRGSAAYNQALGERRADAVVKYLRKKGVAAVRLSKLSWGKSKPLCEESTEACHARNRRVEAILAE